MSNADIGGELAIDNPSHERTQFRMTLRSWKRLHVIMVVGLALLYLASIGTRWRIGGDSALYLLLGESLADGDGYSIWGRPHINVPPLYPIWLATMIRLGFGDMFWLNLGMILMALAGLWFAYLLVREQTNSTWALCVTCVVGFSFEMHQPSLSQLSDIPFMVLVGGGLWCYTRGVRGNRFLLELGTISLITGCWVRVVGIPLAVAAGIGLLLQKREVSARRVHANVLSLAVGILLTVLLFVAWHRTQQSSLPALSYAHHFDTLTHRPWGMWLMQPFLNLHQTGLSYGLLLTGQELPASLATVLFTLPTFVGMWSFTRRREWISVLATIGYLGAIVLLRSMVARYLLPVAPLLVLYYLEGLRCLFAMSSRFHRHDRRIAFTCAVAFVAMNIPKDLLAVFRVHHPRYYEITNKSWSGLMDAAAVLRQSATPGEMFLSNDNTRQLSYLSRAPFLELSKVLLNQPISVDEIRPILDQHQVRLLVFHNRTNNLPLFQTLRQLADDPSEFVEIYRSPSHQVFRRVPSQLVGTTRSL